MRIKKVKFEIVYKAIDFSMAFSNNKIKKGRNSNHD